MLNPTRGVSGPVWDSALPFPFLKVTWELISRSITASGSRTLPLDSLLLFSELEFQATTQWQPLWPLSPCCSEASSLVAFEFLFPTFYGPPSAISWCYLTPQGHKPFCFQLSSLLDLKDHFCLFVLRLGEAFILTVDLNVSPRKELTLIFMSPVSLLRYSCGLVWNHFVHLKTQRRQQNLLPQNSPQLVLCPLPLVGLLVQFWDNIDFPFLFFFFLIHGLNCVFKTAW